MQTKAILMYPLKMKKLPIGISSFEKIREEGYLYIDKTEYAHQLIDRGKYYFLSRPRRFGKSLFVSVLKCLFEGKEKYFEGLFIKEKWEWQKQYPVILIDFNKIGIASPSVLKNDLKKQLHEQAEQFNIKLKDEGSLAYFFYRAIIEFTDKFQQDIAILIDEYDRPIISHLGLGDDRLNIARENRELLKEFYGVIKDNEVSARTKFVFLTGVSKFSQVSVFSELNNLEDITMVREHASLMGVTDGEIDKYLETFVKVYSKERKIPMAQLRDELKVYYNGYCFAPFGESVYNPFSLFRSLKDRQIKNYWFETGTPTFLVNLIKENDYYLPDIENTEVRPRDFSTYELENLTMTALLFQTGYLTIKNIDEDIYTLSYPNLEVKKSFIENLFCDYLKKQNTVIFSRIERALRTGDLSTFINHIKTLFVGLAYPVASRLNEAYFHTIFYLLVSGAGIFVETEVLTADGRIDIAAHFPDRIYIMEFKCGQSGKDALHQIKSKNYAQKYRSLNKPIHLVGVGFSKKNRNISNWTDERLETS